MEFTGERYLPTLDWPDLSYEHWHRYLYAAQFVAGKRVLDLSCGEGFGANLLADIAERVVGIDIDAAAIGHAATRYVRPNLTFACGPAEAVPLAGSHLFDVLVSFETIEHLDEHQQRGFLEEAKRLLAPDGLAIFSTPNKLLYSDRHNYVNEFHRHEFYQEEFVAFLGDYFHNVVLLGQKVYPVSYIWPDVPASDPLWEFRLAFDGSCFSPADGDGKEQLYLLAVCSDVETKLKPPASILLDLAQRASMDRDSQLQVLARLLDERNAEIAQHKRTIQELKGHVEHQATTLAAITEVLTTSLAARPPGGESRDRPFIRAMRHRVEGEAIADANAVTIEWSTGEETPGWVFVSEADADERLFATSAHGSQIAPWVARGATYTFVLYADERRSKVLASVSVN